MSSAAKVRATLGDVASRAGVSVATASKVLNARPDVSPSTRARVEEAIHALGYAPVRRPREAAGGSIAFLTDMVNSAYATEILRGALLACEELGLDLVVERLHQSEDLRIGFTSASLTHRLLAGERMGAVALTAGLPEDVYVDVQQARLPLVMIDPLDSTYPEAHSVGATNWLGGRSAAEHLIELGHRRLGVMSGPQHSLSAMARLDGFVSACSQAKLGLGSALIRSSPFGTAEARQVARNWFEDLPSLPTGVMAGSDTQALGILQAAGDLGLRVPDDLSIVSYDDTFLAAMANPPLTAVHQPLTGMGRHAVEAIVQLHQGEHRFSHHMELATRLVTRDSTAAPSRIETAPTDED